MLGSNQNNPKYNTRSYNEDGDDSSRFKLGVDETNSPEDFNERETGFKIPSEIQISEYKQTFISNPTNKTHFRAESNLSN